MEANVSEALTFMLQGFGVFALAYSQFDHMSDHPHCAHGSEMAQKELLVQAHSPFQQTPGAVYFPFKIIYFRCLKTAQ